jgi:non-homologous end joining protein Ku
VARQLIDAMTHSLDLTAFKDEYRLKLEELIERKRHGKKTVEVADDHPDEPMPRTINLMDALKRSLKSSPRANGRHPRRRHAKAA